MHDIIVLAFYLSKLFFSNYYLDFNYDIGFAFQDLTLLLLTSGRDPGIVPRNAHPPEPEIYEGNNEVGGVQTPQLRLPRTKDVNVNGVTVKVKYCDTCMLYRLLVARTAQSAITVWNVLIIIAHGLANALGL